MLSLLCLCLTVGSSQVADIGGGPLIILLLIFAITFPVAFLILGVLKMLMPLVYIIMAGSSLMSMTIHIKKINPLTNKYCIDYDLIMLVLPVAASGAFFGELIKNLISEMLLTTLEVFLMAYLIFIACRQGQIIYTNTNFEMFHNQSNLNNDKLTPLIQQGHELQQIDKNKKENNNNNQQKFNDKPQRPEQDLNPELQKILEEESNRLPKRKLKIIGLILLYTIVLFFIKNVSETELVIVNPDIDIPDGFENGTEPIIQQDNTTIMQNKYHELQKLLDSFQGFEIGVSGYGQQDDGTYYDPFQYTIGLKSCFLGTLICFVIHATLGYLSSKSVAIQAVAQSAQKQKYGYVFVGETDKMNSKKMWANMISGFVAGLFVGLLGIGSSIVLIPTWVSNGVDQETATKSSIPVTFFSSIICICLAAFTGFYTPYSYFILLLFFILSYLITMVTYFILNKLTVNDLNKNLSRKLKLMLAIPSLILLILYYILQYSVNEKYFTHFGFFC